MNENPCVISCHKKKKEYFEQLPNTKTQRLDFYHEYVNAAMIQEEECPREVTRPVIGPTESRVCFPSGVSTTAGSRAARSGASLLPWNNRQKLDSCLSQLLPINPALAWATRGAPQGNYRLPASEKFVLGGGGGGSGHWRLFGEGGEEEKKMRFSFFIKVSPSPSPLVFERLKTSSVSDPALSLKPRNMYRCVFISNVEILSG